MGYTVTIDGEFGDDLDEVEEKRREAAVIEALKPVVQKLDGVRYVDATFKRHGEVAMLLNTEK